MEPVSPVIPGQEQPEVVYAKDQPQYRPLPSLKNENGDVLTRWELSAEEKLKILEQGYFYLTVSTFNRPLQPLLMTVDPPEGWLPQEEEKKEQGRQNVLRRTAQDAVEDLSAQELRPVEGLA